MALYSEKVMDHFQNPRNVGKIDDADGVGEVGNARCGDIMRMYLKIKDGIIEDCKFNHCHQLHGYRAHQGQKGGRCA